MHIYDGHKWLTCGYQTTQWLSEKQDRSAITSRLPSCLTAQVNALQHSESVLLHEV